MLLTMLRSGPAPRNTGAQAVESAPSLERADLRSWVAAVLEALGVGGVRDILDGAAPRLTLAGAVRPAPTVQAPRARPSQSSPPSITPLPQNPGPFTAGVHIRNALNFVRVRFPNWSVT